LKTYQGSLAEAQVEKIKEIEQLKQMSGGILRNWEKSMFEALN